MGLVGTAQEVASVGHLARVAADAERWGMPLLAELLPGGWDAPQVEIGDVATAARIGAELGATLVKVPFRGDVRSFRTVTRSCFVPVVVLGGGEGGDVAERLGPAMLAGAAGVAVGRDVWLARDPGAVTRELVSVVHGGRALPTQTTPDAASATSPPPSAVQSSVDGKGRQLNGPPSARAARA